MFSDSNSEGDEIIPENKTNEEEDIGQDQEPTATQLKIIQMHPIVIQ